MPSANNFTSHGGAASGTQIVDRVLGESYNKVRVVYDNLTDIVSVADNIADINLVVDNLSLLGSVVQDVQEQIELAIDGKKDLFIAGMDYVKDTSTELTLTNTPAQLNSVQVFFNGIYQNKNTYSRINRVITFNVPIVVDKVEIHYNVPSMYVDLSGTAAHEFETNVENSKNGAETAKITAIAQANAATAAKVIAETSANMAVLAASAASASAVNAAASEAATLAAVDMAVDGKKDLFTAGVHYTINVSTALTLTTAPAQQNAVHVYFDGVYQNKDTYTLAGTALTFTSAIDVGSVEVQYAVPSMYVDLSSPIAQAFEANVDAAKDGAEAASDIATTARVAAEAARDAALFRAEAYGSVALALADAGLTVGQQFAALSEDLLTVGIYRKDAGPVAFGPIAIYPTSAGVNANFNLTQSALFSLSTSLINTQTIVTTHHAFKE